MNQGMQVSSPAGYCEGSLGRLTSTISLIVRMPCWWEKGRGEQGILDDELSGGEWR